MKYSLSQNDLKKIGTGFLIALAGAAITWLGEVTGQIDAGAYTPFLAAGSAVLINLLRKFIIDTQEK